MATKKNFFFESVRKFTFSFLSRFSCRPFYTLFFVYLLLYPLLFHSLMPLIDLFLLFSSSFSRVSFHRDSRPSVTTCISVETRSRGRDGRPFFTSFSPSAARKEVIGRCIEEKRQEKVENEMMIRGKLQPLSSMNLQRNPLTQTSGLKVD